MSDLLVLAAVVFLGLALWWAWRGNAKRDAEREAALRIETEKTIQAQRAAYDAPGVTEAAAQDVPKRKHRKKGHG